MENRKSDKVNLIAFILAITAFLMAISAFLVKYFWFGETDFSVLAGGIVIPAIVISVLKLRQSK